jgi:hypothetical protein
METEGPVAQMDKCNANSEIIHDFGVFDFDQKVVAVHYDKYSGDYDSIQTMTGFNDPFVIAKCLVRLLNP